MAGQGPSVRWRRNKAGTKRTIEEAGAIARKHGVQIPDDVVFFEAEPGEVEGSWKDLFTPRGMETARGPAMPEHPDGYIYWDDHYNIADRIPFLIHLQVAAGHRGNFHDQAWDAADDAVLRMRKAKQ